MNPIETLKYHNKWRRNGEGEMCNPAELGVAIDTVIADYEVMKKQNDELRDKVAKYEGALNSVIDLIDNSTGVAGLHKNGEVAEWDSILAGGHFEEWLIDLSEAININHANRIKEG